MWNSQSKNKKNSKAMQINQCQLSSHLQVEYLYCMDKKASGDNIENIVVIIHGISRNAHEIIERFSQSINQNTLLIAPVFSKKYALDYQRLGRKGKGPRADYILDAVVNELRDKYKISCNKINLFGFSAGAQFAHRYAFAHPTAVNKVAIVAAGWYTLPSLNLSYPQGLKLKDEFTDINFELQRLLRIRFRVYIGEKDYLRDKSLNKTQKIDVLQGLNRIERAKNWIELMQSQFNKNQISNKIDLITLRGVVHDFKDADINAQLCEKVFNWFNDIT